jgi:hypothetical protein
MHGMPSEELEFAIGLEKCAMQEPKFAALYFVAAKYSSTEEREQKNG